MVKESDKGREKNWRPDVGVEEGDEKEEIDREKTV